jgi:putative ABC transport system substrate-binding protein
LDCVASATQSVRAQDQAKQHRIAIIIPSGPVARLSDTLPRLYQPFFEELRRLGDIEGQHLTIERYSGEGQREGLVDLARKVVNRNPDLIVAITNPVAQAVRAASGTIPIVWIGGEPLQAGFATAWRTPGWKHHRGHRLLLGNLREAAADPQGRRPLGIQGRVSVAARGVGPGGQSLQRTLQEVGRRLGLSVIPMLLQESTAPEYQRVFAEIAPEGPDALIVNDIVDHFPYRQLIVELAEKSRLPAIYGYREYVEAGGLMAYGADFGELMRRMADDVHQILNGTKPGDIPIYQGTKFEFVINLKAAKALGLTIPPALLARADEVIE